jgi:type III secretory pathway component EscV
LNLNRLIINAFLEDQDEEEYSTSIEDISVESVEIIPSPLVIDRQPQAVTAVAIAATGTTTTPKKITKKEERKESLQRASAWALERRRNKKKGT